MLSAQQLTIGSGSVTHFGRGSVKQLPAIVLDLSCRRAFLVTDRGLVGAGVAGEVERILQGAGLETAVFDGVHPNPDTETLRSGAELFRPFGRGAVVALGGGSVLDTAKGVALLATNQGSPRDFDYRHEPPHPGLPVVAIPTTSGTGSETNSYGVIGDPAANRKFYVGHRSVIPRAVILDPDLTYGLPPGPTAATGMDVLAHALESLSARRSNPYAEGINVQVVRMVAEFLPRAVADGQDAEARAQMLLAAHMAGLAFVTTGLGMGHALAHALGARVGAAHGLALSVLLPHVLRFNLPVRSEVYARVAQILGVSASSAGDRANAAAAVEAVRRLAADLGMPATLRDLGLVETMVPAVAVDALADEVMANTPRLPSASELEAVLWDAM